ncbi:uncharacterized protein EV420DRAFT_1683112 [Desarmillaria tabescens]|uniref:Uncharacterized protein n=1 Tax=Armillaria tabescens TaxID=1929756 RepID=A0AA39KDU0_ARMTA|nr:uncharacterized protein EV420DRAFT_1683112 [Desarmillaria tabescens]KAK0457944.1 hypothetical protein EV420DRAFT_1683112 [Desarmillaria tabescens]
MGIGQQLLQALETSSIKDHATITAAWHQDFCELLISQGAGRLRSLVSWIPIDFPKAPVLTQYIIPLTSQSRDLLEFPDMQFPSQPDIPKLAQLCKELFIWGHPMGIVQNFSDHVFPGLAIRELMQDLCKQRGLIPDSNNQLSPHAVIAKACSIRANQRERSGSEIFISLIIPYKIVSSITSSIDGKYDTDASRAKFKQWLNKSTVRVWLSRVLTLHVRPSILDHIERQASAAAKKCHMLKSRNQAQGANRVENIVRLLDMVISDGTQELMPPPPQPRALTARGQSYPTSIDNIIGGGNIKLPKNLSRESSVIEIPSDEDNKPKSMHNHPEIPVDKGLRDSSVIEISSDEDNEPNSMHKNLETVLEKHSRDSSSVVEISSDEDNKRVTEPVKRKRQRRTVSPKYHIEEKGAVLEFFTDDEDSI